MVVSAPASPPQLALPRSPTPIDAPATTPDPALGAIKLASATDTYARSDRPTSLLAPAPPPPQGRTGAALDPSPPGSQGPIEIRRGSARAQAKALAPLDRATFATPDVFDPRFYATHYPDLAKSGVVTDAQLEQHWLTHGLREGRQASPTFSTLWAQQEYGRGHPDLVATPEQTVRTWSGLSAAQKANIKTSALTADLPFGDNLKLDLYSPPGVPPGQKVPVVIALVGGGFLSAEKAHPTQVELGTILAHHGIAVVSPEYHVTQGADPRRFPAAQDDVQDALRYVRDHAEERGWDLSRVTVLGGSAGGNLALNAAMNPALAADDLPPIRNVVALAPATDLTRDVLANGTPSDDAAAGWLDAYIAPADRAGASPISYVGNPANAQKRFYFAYAEDDAVLLPGEQATPFLQAMKDQQLTIDARATGGHGDWLHPELADNPAFDREAYAVIARWILAG